MFCGKCGAKIPDGASFCQQCGASTEGVQPQAAGGATAAVLDHTKANLRHRNIGIAAVAAAAVVVAVLLFTLLSGRGYKATVTKFMDAVFDADAKTIVSLLPDKIADSVLGSMKQDRLDALSKMGRDLEDRIDRIRQRFGVNFGLSYEILDARDVSERELQNCQSAYAKYDVTVSAAKYVEVKVTLKVGDMEGSSTLQIPVIKVGRSWYMDVDSLSSIIYAIFGITI